MNTRKKITDKLVEDLGEGVAVVGIEFTGGEEQCQAAAAALMGDRRLAQLIQAVAIKHGVTVNLVEPGETVPPEMG